MSALLVAIGDLAERIVVMEATPPITPVFARKRMAALSLPVMSDGATKRNVLTARSTGYRLPQARVDTPGPPRLICLVTPHLAPSR